MKIGIVGCEGKLSLEIINSLAKFESCNLICAIASEKSKNINSSIALFSNYTKNDVKISSNILECELCDVIIDATNRDVFMDKNYVNYLKLKKPLIIATTGFSENDYYSISKLSEEIPVIQANNFSFELFRFIETIKFFIKKKRKIDISIIEEHHRYKKDAPSGTAILIRDAILECDNNFNIEICSIRGGTIYGTHKVIISNDKDEEIIFTHRVNSRQVFAEGILQVSLKIINYKNGLYEMKDFVELL